MRVWFAALIAVSAAIAATAGKADGLNRTYTGAGVADFSGVDFGLNLGASMGSSANINTSGASVGAHLGYNLQNGALVGGVATDILFGNISGGNGGYGSVNVSSLSSLRGKAGYAFGDVLAYGTIGLAYADSRYNSFAGDWDKSLHGMTFGVGAEYALTRNVSVNGELRRYVFDTATYYIPAGPTAATTTQNMLLFGLSGHF